MGGEGVKHIVLAKFKDDVSEEKINEFIKNYSDLVNLIEPLKAFQWGTELSASNMDQGFSHVFESSFESVQGLNEFVSDSHHIAFGKSYASIFDKLVIFDYNPTIISYPN
ncbi:stress-response A/B barrel domain-containing protein HS1-like [Impatiens glandulifera]|uniref:stress-response A/B barrel domain-containing protein HS1-like n=1 Tax=Impatiens glandulifera TaxID=253017 RepID=UPI001FB14E60|nr:stress-response A/B barrel domain-containing protein HS1-like [Impatiens glandulifera]